MEIGVQRFFGKIEDLQKKGLPDLCVLNDKIMTLFDYKQRIATMAKDSSKFSGIQGNITGKCSWRLCSMISTYNTKSSTSSSSSRLFLNTPRWTKSTAGYWKLPSQAHKDGMSCVNWLSTGKASSISVSNTVKVIQMTHQWSSPKSAWEIRHIIISYYISASC